MNNAAILDQLMKALNGVLPPGLTDDIRDNMQAVLKTRLTDLGLVTREEFEIQSALLARTQEKLQELEKLTRDLEQKLNQ
ncbi:MAG: accessory factor UbiK family protein [Acidiferrobacterales bacterium]